jgi:hypothetical protein
MNILFETALCRYERNIKLLNTSANQILMYIPINRHRMITLSYILQYQIE